MPEVPVRRPLVLDCDPGHDDAVAILLAVAAPELDVRAVTTVFGNCTVENATRNALQVLDLAGRPDIPVAVGAAHSLRSEQALGTYVHGDSGLDGPQLAPPSRAADARTADELLVEVLADAQAVGEQVTVVATGPITNVGLLISEHPELLPVIAEVIFMGGSTERGNHTPAAEFNTFADPEALQLVLDSAVRVRMVGLNLTHQALATPAVVERFAAMPHRLGEVVAAWLGFFGGSYRRVWDFAAPPVHDPCTVAALLRPNVIDWQEAFCAVELTGTWTRGATVVDLDHRLGREPNCGTAMTLDAGAFWDLVIESVDRLGCAYG